MQCKGYSVIHGTEISEFDVEQAATLLNQLETALAEVVFHKTVEYAEIDRFESEVSDWEQREYFEIF